MFRKTIILSVVYCLSISTFGQIQNYQFKHITKNQGLNSNRVHTIGQDKTGFIWIGTPEGLQRYDGYEFKTYHRRAHYGQSPLFEDNYGSLWMICEGGDVYRLDLETEKFKQYPSVGNMTWNLYNDMDGIIWAATKGYGIARYVHDSDTFITYKHDPTNNLSLNSDNVSVIYKDSKKNVWIGTQKGLNLFDTDKGNFKQFIDGPKATLLDIKEDNMENLWLGTTNGLYEFNSLKDQFVHYSTKDLNKVEVIYIDSQNIIWLVTNLGILSFDQLQSKFLNYHNYTKNSSFDYGVTLEPILERKDGSIWSVAYRQLSVYGPSSRDFIFFHPDPLNIYSVNDELFCNIFEDDNSNLWLGTMSGGINYIAVHSDNFTFYPKKSVTTLYMDKTGTLWVGSHNGIFKVIKKNGNIYYNKVNGINNIVCQITEDDSGNLWIAGERGLVKFNMDTEKITNYPFDLSQRVLIDSRDRIWTCSWHPDLREKTWIGTKADDPVNTGKILFSQIHNIHPYFLYEDHSSNIWVLGFRKMAVFDSDSCKPINLQNIPLIKSMYEDDDNNLWAVSADNRIFTINITKGVLNDFTPVNDLIDGRIEHILAINRGTLWLLTWNGITSYNLETGIVKNYSTKDGIAPPTIGSNVPYCQGNNGEIYIASNEGYFMFHPDSIQNYSSAPPIVFTDFKIKNKSVEISDSTYLKKNINDVEVVELPFNENIFSIGFAALDYTAPLKNKYAYKLEGFNKDWLYTSANKRQATYTNLNPGNYVFKVKGTNSDGVWHEEGASLKIIILSPWWYTWWAYSIYVVIIFLILMNIYFQQKRRLRLKHEMELKDFESKKIQEVDKLKSRFFTNISHEFRTPLTMILGPVKGILEYTTEEKTKKHLKIVDKNANKLLELVNQLLDISKMESGKMRLRTNPQNIVSLLKALISSFALYAERKRITLKFISEEDDIAAYIDKDKFDKIITNLLSNAFKFTPNEGRIDVILTCGSFNSNFNTQKECLGRCVKIRITDSGVGIPKDHLSKIFDRFYQVDGSDTREQEGTGIGLSIAKELVELHKGRIEVESEVGKGTSFIIFFPLGRKHLMPEEICQSEEETRENVVVSSEMIYREDGCIEKSDFEFLSDNGNPILLLVEDNFDVRNYIKEHLQKEFRILEAGDGDEGWNISLQYTPDLIVSDVMMPKMDGFELCGKLKTDERTSHIPVILLTAKAESSDKIEGYETGADDYIMKPFEPEELISRIKNLLLQRIRLHEHFRKEGIFEIEGKNITSIDKKFLQNAVSVINEHISEPTFGVGIFAELMNMSKSLLFKKLSSLTGLAPVEFIRRTRLNKAAVMIERHYGNISEVALEVGFNNPSYFAECFKKQYGVSPKQYSKQNYL